MEYSKQLCKPTSCTQSHIASFDLYYRCKSAVIICGVGQFNLNCAKNVPEHSMETPAGSPILQFPGLSLHWPPIISWLHLGLEHSNHLSPSLQPPTCKPSFERIRYLCLIIPDPNPNCWQKRLAPRLLSQKWWPQIGTHCPLK